MQLLLNEYPLDNLGPDHRTGRVAVELRFSCVVWLEPSEPEMLLQGGEAEHLRALIIKELQQPTVDMLVIVCGVTSCSSSVAGLLTTSSAAPSFSHVPRSEASVSIALVSSRTC